MRKIDFVIAGSAKSGTTALNLMLDQHPQVYTSDIKETNFFIEGFEPTRHYISHNGTRVLANQDESDIIDTPEKYASLFENVDSDDNLLLGEASPWYLLNPRVPERLLEHNPDIKIIITLRNPSDVAFANFVHQVRDRAECISIDDMNTFFDHSRYEDERLHPFADHLGLPKYSNHLPAYLETIPAKNLHLMIYEEFRQDRQAALAEVLRFLGLPDNYEINTERTVNISGLPKSDLLQDLIQGSMRFKKTLGLILPKKPRRRLRAYIEALNTGKKAELDSQSRDTLNNMYVDDINYVAQLMSRELPGWGRDS